MNKLFENQTVIISGGLGDIGRATALEFAQQGAAVALCDIHPAAAATELLNTLSAFGIQCRYSQVDVTVAKAVQLWIDETEQALGTPGIIIANAAIVTLAGMHTITPEQWSQELAVNLNGAFYLTRYATARLLEKGLPGRVVFVGSWAAASVHAHIPAYSVAKAGVRMLCKCMALELAPHQILVNEIAPGYVAAGLSGRIWEEQPGKLEEAIARVPIRKIMSAKSVADQILYLCHPQQEHMTGMTLLMDGGLSLLS
ncbi:SDR family oxidoreductase [Chitinophaga sp. MM2321]|uniref:SDR family NAD(P)-dependent oxidoreductase n=1 Tax=Chitinophaga sp. MM2321 TaxID=3137178 RepID=UPI0032D57604